LQSSQETSTLAVKSENLFPYSDRVPDYPLPHHNASESVERTFPISATGCTETTSQSHQWQIQPYYNRTLCILPTFTLAVSPQIWPTACFVFSPLESILHGQTNHVASNTGPSETLADPIIKNASELLIQSERGRQFQPVSHIFACLLELAYLLYFHSAVDFSNRPVHGFQIW